MEYAVQERAEEVKLRRLSTSRDGVERVLGGNTGGR